MRAVHNHHNVLPKKLFAWIGEQNPQITLAEEVVDAAGRDGPGVFTLLETRPEGLTTAEADVRHQEFGPNVLARDQQAGIGTLVRRAVVNPLVVLLAVLAAISFVTGDVRAGAVMTVMIVLGVGLKLIQEARADRAAARLKAMISVKATVLRDGQPCELPVARLVPGDVVMLAAGDMIPADVRLIETKVLFVTQAALTGESFPVEKSALPRKPGEASLAELANIGFLGTSVESGSAKGVVVCTGAETYLGSMAESITQNVPPTAFDRGLSQFTWLILRFILLMVPVVFLLNGLTKGSWGEAFFFAVAVAVGLTPEMLPMIVSVCLSKGALAMSRKKVIMKRLNAIQNLGAMDVLCTDKTGTLTMDRIILEKHCDVMLKDDEGVLALAYLNSHFQTGLKNVLDRAILAHTETHHLAGVAAYAKVDEIPFDFQRRIMSVVVRTPTGNDQIIAKGAPEAIFARCAAFERDGERHPMEHLVIDELKQEYERLSADGFRVLAIASRESPPPAGDAGHAPGYTTDDERDLVLNGYVAFLDPPKETARTAIAALQGHGVRVKVLTGDNELVARKVCVEVGLSVEHVLRGPEIETLSNDDLAVAAERATLFARVSPAHKQRIIAALQSRQHTVGFMGDGINDAPALRTADVGISVDTAVDIAKESADMILLEKSLLVLEQGVIEGRKVFANILKYVRMGASSNFGNMFSVLGASVFVPFLPMAPIQILANNLLYDISQTAIPTDEVDPEQIEKPRPWDIQSLARYILFIGPCSSVFDYVTFFVMLTLFKCANVSTPEAAAQSASLFQTGWFVESLLTQTLIIHIIRTNRIPLIQSMASWQLVVTSAIIILIGIGLPFSPIGRDLGFTALPALYWPILALILFGYFALTQGVKMWLLKKKWI